MFYMSVGSLKNNFKNLYRALFLEDCLQHHGHKGDPGVMPGICGAIGERVVVPQSLRESQGGVASVGASP